MQRQRVDQPRLLATEILVEVEAKLAFANLVLPRRLRDARAANPRFTDRDAAFVAELVYGSLRQRRYLDTVISHFSSRSLDQIDPTILEILRLGAYQILFMRVPSHAAVAEMVEIARRLSGDGLVGFTNAILRQISRLNDEDVEEIFSELSALDRIGATTSHPNWIVEAYRQALTYRGFDAGELEQALASNNIQPKVSLVARPGLIKVDELADEAEDILSVATSPGSLSPHAVTLLSGDPAALPSIRTAKAGVQDEGSQIAALLLAEAPLSGSDKNWLDLCAGPGGKAALLGAYAAKREAQLVANEVNSRRAKLVESSTAKLPNVRVTCADGRTYPETASGYDRILVDAPCSGLGSLRRRPESRWRHLESDIPELVSIQEDLFDRAISLARSGGLIAWVTCTPVIEETLGQVARVLKTNKVKLVDAPKLALPWLGSAAGLTGSSWPAHVSELEKEVARKTIQLWTHSHGTDAMFICLLEKV